MRKDGSLSVWKHIYIFLKKGTYSNKLFFILVITHAFVLEIRAIEI